AKTASTPSTKAANCSPTGTLELPAMFPPPWSSASAGGWPSSFSSPARTPPQRTASTLWLPDNRLQPTPGSGPAGPIPLALCGALPASSSVVRAQTSRRAVVGCAKGGRGNSHDAEGEGLATVGFDSVQCERSNRARVAGTRLLQRLDFQARWQRPRHVVA